MVCVYKTVYTGVRRATDSDLSFAVARFAVGGTVCRCIRQGVAVLHMRTGPVRFSAVAVAPCISRRKLSRGLAHGARRSLRPDSVYDLLPFGV